MKRLSVIVLLALSTAAFASDRYEPTGSTGAAGSTETQPEIRGRIHRLGVRIEQNAELLSNTAKAIFGRTGNGDRISPNEVEAVSAIVMVKDASQDFRIEAARSEFRSMPANLTNAFRWLNEGSYQLAGNNLIKAYDRFDAPMANINSAMAKLREIYLDARRVGWDMAEVVQVANQLARETEQVIDLAEKEMDTRNEVQLVREMRAFEVEAKSFDREVARIERPSEARAALKDNFGRLKTRYNVIDSLMHDSRFSRFSKRVQDAFNDVSEVFIDLKYAFLTE